MREKDILKDLVDSERYIKIEELAKRYHVSERTIRNDIKYLTQISKNNGFEIMLKRKEGYYIIVYDQTILQNFMKEDGYDSPIKDRIVVILTKLLLETSYLTQDDLADELQISKSMIKLDMNKVEERLIAYHLTLDRKAHYGICVNGSIQARKELLLDLMETSEDVERYLDDLIHDDHMQQIDKLLVETLRKYELSTNYAEMMKLDHYLKVFIACHKKGLITNDIVDVKDTTYHTIASTIKDQIERMSTHRITPCEVCELANYIRQKTKPKTVQLEYDEELKADILKFLKEADSDYQTAFLSDEDFIQSLFAHVSLLVDRLHQSISFDNPLVNEISAKYPEIFNISIKFATMLEQRYKVKATQDEIGFIATHFAAHMEKEHRNKLRSFNKIAIVCSSGGGSAFLIKLKIESLFLDANVETFSFMEMEDLKAFTPDIIFTIKELDESFNVPIVLIKELLNDEDIQKIKHMFEFCGVEKKQNYVAHNFTSMFHEDAFWMFETGDYHNILKMMSHNLEQQGYAKEGYQSYVLQREEVLSTVYLHGVAIPHPIEMYSDINMLAVGIVKHDLQENDKAVKVIFMVNLMKGSLEIHQNISRVLFDLMNDEKLVEKIRRSSSYEEFMKQMNALE